MSRVQRNLLRSVLIATALVAGVVADARAGGGGDFQTRKVKTAIGKTNAIEMANERDGRGQTGAMRWHGLKRGTKGGIDFERLEFDTPYGHSQVIEVKGTLQNQIKIGKETYLVAKRKDGTIVYRNSAGKLFVGDQLLRTPSGRRQTRLGATTMARTALGLQEVVLYSSYIQRVVPGEGADVSFKNVAIETPYGTSTVKEVDGELRNQLAIGGETFLVAKRADGEVVYRNERGALFPPGRPLRTLDGRRLTQHGVPFLVETATGKREMVETGDHHVHKTVTWRAGHEPKLSTATLDTPYGRSKVVERDGVLRHELKIGDEVYLVDQRKDGAIVYRDARGHFYGPGRTLRAANGRRQTQYGPVRTLTLATGPVDVVMKNGTYMAVGLLTDGKLPLLELPSFTVHGTAKVVERSGRLRFELKVGKQRYLVGTDAEKKTVFRDARGRMFREKELLSSDDRPQTRYGPAEEMETATGRRHVVIARKQYDHSKRIRQDKPYYVSPADGYSSRTREADLETPYGMSRIVRVGGRLRHQIRIGDETYLVGASKGGFVLRDRTGQEFGPGDTLRTPDGRLQTKYGTAEPMDTAGGPVDVIRYTEKSKTKGKRGKTSVWIVRVGKKGALEYERADFETEVGRATARSIGGRLRLAVSHGGQTYLVARGSDGRVSYQTADGALHDRPPSVTITDRAPKLRSLYRARLPQIDPDQQETIGGASHGSLAEYQELRDGALDILRRYPPSEYVYVGVGRSPSALFAVLENLAASGGGPLALVFPASGLQGQQPDSAREAYFEHFRALLPREVRFGQRRILLVDRSNPGSGTSIVNLQGMLKAYLREVGSNTRVEGVGLSNAPLGHGLDHIDTTHRRVLQALSSSTYEAISKYPSHTIGRHRLKDVVERPEYGAFRRVMAERMKRDPVLHQALQELGR